MTQIVTDASPVFYTAEPVVNADHTITGSNGRMIMYSGLTAARVLTLPAATQMMQTIMVMDEDGSCNLTNSITLTCSGTDKIEGNPTRLMNYPYAALTIESTGNGAWTVVANPNPSLSAGIQIAPTFTDNGDGSITFTSGLYCFYTNSTGVGKIKRFNLPGNTFTLTDNTNQYIVADYNSGSPTIYVTTNVAVIDEITVIPLYTVYRRGTVLHVLEWDSLGDALGNKTHKSIVKTQRFRTEPGGLGLGEAATQLVTVGSGTVWHGAVSNALAAFNSSVNTMWLAYHVAGVWTFTTITQYNNTQWDDGTNLQTLPGGKYAVNFVYRVVGTNDTTTIVFLGQGAYSLGDAQASQPPANLPGEVLSHCVLVGRIIVNQGGSTATQIDSAFSTIFSPAGVTDHNSLLNLQGGTSAQYYHLTSAEYTGTGTGNFVRASGPSVATPTFTTSATFPFLTSGRVHFSTTGGAVTDNANFTYTTGTGLKVADTTASTSTTTGAFILSGGMGIAGNIVSGGSIGLGVSPSTPIHLYSTSTNSDGGLRLENSTATSAGGTRYGSILQGGSSGYGISGWANSLVIEGDAAGGLVLGAYDGANGATIKFQVSRSTLATLNSSGQFSMNGNFVAGTNTLTSNLYCIINTSSGYNRRLQVQSGGLARWSFAVNNAAETGSNAGSDFQLIASSDAGTDLDFPIGITRAAGGTITLGGTTNRTVALAATTASTSTTTGSGTVAGGLGVAGSVNIGGYLGSAVGSPVASATTISPTGRIFHVTGTTAIATINLPYTGFTGSIKIIPDGLFTTTTAGNIALASTAVVSKVLEMVYDGSKWFPSY